MTAPAATQPHAAAIVTTLAAAPLTTYLGEATRAATGDLPARPYVVVHPSPAFHDGTLGDRFKDATMDFQTTAVGDTAEQAMAAHDKAVTALLGATPAVSGRVPHPIYKDETGQPVRRDDSGAQPVFYVIQRWTFHTTT